MSEIIIEELHYIAHIRNIPSILQHGILCHNEAQKLSHVDISMNEIQERRANKKVLNAMSLHEYANLYFDAHNPMLSKRRDQNSDICILRIKTEVLNLNGVVLSDQNASAEFARFYDSPHGLQHLDFEIIFDPFWTNDDPFEYRRRKSIKCAEVLVPNRVFPEMIFGAYVCNSIAEGSLKEIGFTLPITIKSSIFF
jgi:hypothetical protein